MSVVSHAASPTAVEDTLVVELGDRSYPIRIVSGPVVEPARHAGFWHAVLDEALAAPEIAFVTNDTIAPLYGDALAHALERSGRRVVRIVVPDGETHKDARMVDAIHDAMLEARLDRKAVLVALGGGVVGDVAGFAAATYQRGIRFVQVPTTLLAQVDSSVGGKTGINHRLGKNMIGAFHQPSAVVVDLATLQSLPPREYAAGVAEIVKYGAALDAPFFAWLEASMPALMGRDRDALTHAIRRSCTIKAEVVGQDERESGRRALLNFGHTFGHAIEGATGYGAWLHGEAVAMGMVLASRLSERLGLIDRTLVDRIVALLGAAGLPVVAPALTHEQWISWMSSDKKAESGRIRFVVLEALGRSRVTAVDEDVLDAVLDKASSPARGNDRTSVSMASSS